MPKFKDFEEVVKTKARKYLDDREEKEVEEFLNGEEAEKTIKNSYEYYEEKMKNGETTEQKIMGDGANGCAYCLMMMF